MPQLRRDERVQLRGIFLRAPLPGQNSESVIGARRPFGRGAALLGLFVALQTFVLLARGDRWEVLLSFTREMVLLTVLLWLKDLGLAVLLGVLFVFLFAFAEQGETGGEPGARWRGPGGVLAAGVVLFFLAVAVRWVAPQTIPPGIWVDPLFSAEPFSSAGAARHGWECHPLTLRAAVTS